MEAEVQPSAALVFKHYLVSAGLYGAVLVLYALNPWFYVNPNYGLLRASFEGVSGLQCYWWLYLAYVALALPIYLLTRPAMLLESKNLLVFGVLCRAPKALAAHFRRRPPLPISLTQKEKYAIAFLLIKLFYGPLMLNGALAGLHDCRELLRGVLRGTELYYMMFVSLVFLVDSCIFFVGYHTEAGFLDNRVRHVETNIWHILVCVACYGPFINTTLSLLGSSATSPYIVILGDYRSVWTWLFRGVAIFALLLLISASASLFTKASNLTNRGIVSWGPYRYIRHPGYLGKNLFWLMTLVPMLIPSTNSMFFSWKNYLLTCVCTIAGFLAWGTIYFLRAITEERFLSRDPDYVAYCKRVKWRFIPGVY